MIIGAIILFLLAMLFGWFIVVAIFKNKPTPAPAVFAHGMAAIFGLLVLIAYTVGHPTALLITGDILLVLAALGGFTMLTIDMDKKPIPKIIAIIHPLVAVSGVIVLIVYAYNTYVG